MKQTHHHPVAAVPTEAQLKWALLHTHQQSAIQYDETVLNESQSEYTERHNDIQAHGYRHESTLEEQYHRQRRIIRMNERYAFGRRCWPQSSSSAVFGEDSDDPERTARFQRAFAAAVAAVEGQSSHENDTKSPASLVMETPPPSATKTLVWTPALRDQVTTAAKSVLQQKDDDDDEVHSFVRQFEAFMLEDTETDGDHVLWTPALSPAGNGNNIFGTPAAASQLDKSVDDTIIVVDNCYNSITRDDHGSAKHEDSNTRCNSQESSPKSLLPPSAGCGLSVIRGWHVPPEQFGNVQWERRMMP